MGERRHGDTVSRNDLVFDPSSDDAGLEAAGIEREKIKA
jgi:hypothetical protein